MGELPAGVVTTTEGLPTTTVARSVVEAACSAGYEAAVALCDSALHSGRVTKADLRAILDQMKAWPRTGTALAAVAFADGLSESVGESRLRVLMETHGLPEPELQVQFGAADLVARVDFYFRRYGVVVEFDGMIKYRAEGLDAVVREKYREDRLRSAGLLVVRVTWDDLSRPNRLVDRIRQAFAWSETADERRVSPR
ncbi:hypothetical protein [Kribbella sp. NPDC051620]|uniref:hypothetical protein n=1 Tax=Kribbella sp. NPDC051620 TaxID=3364120 RepID=UPI0037B79091